MDQDLSYLSSRYKIGLISVVYVNSLNFYKNQRYPKLNQFQYIDIVTIGMNLKLIYWTGLKSPNL